jgi:hypothetical protein
MDAGGRPWTIWAISDRHIRTLWTYMECPGRLLRDCETVGCGFGSHPRSTIYLRLWSHKLLRTLRIGANLGRIVLGEELELILADRHQSAQELVFIG